MSRTMRALVKRHPKPGIWLEQVPVPEIGPNEVLIRLDKTAICGTDLHIYNWDEWSQRKIQPGLVIGHEFVGHIERLGSEVSGYSVGERVSAEGHIACGVCRNCKRGKAHLCPHTIGIGVSRDGAFAEYVAMPASNLWRIPDAIPSELAAFFDPFGNACHSALRYDLVGEDVLITGAGPIGIMAAGICRHVGARHVVVSDVNDYRLQLAAEMGIEGFDIGLEMSGNGQAFEDMLEHMYPAGKIALLGILPGDTQIDWNQIIFKGLEINGIYGRLMYETWYKMTQMVLGGFPLHKVLTHRLPIDDFEHGFELMRSGECGKVVCEWNP